MDRKCKFLIMCRWTILFMFERNELCDGPNVEYVEEAEDTLENILNMNVDEVAEKWYNIAYTVYNNIGYEN